jgi:hypothetical protein
MKLLAAAVIVSALVAVSGSADASSARSACMPKSVTVRGHHPGVIECGPAKATIRFNGKTLRYEGGTCKALGVTLSLYIGTHVTGGGSDHLFYLYLSKRSATTYTPSTGLIGIQLGYASYHWNSGTLKTTAGAKSGTVKGTLVKFPQTKPAGSFSGSYSC